MSLKALLEKSEKLREAATKVVAWYAHSDTVRGPFNRWFECTQVIDEHRKHVAETPDDCAYAAHAMNTSKTKDEIIKVLWEALSKSQEALWDGYLEIDIALRATKAPELLNAEVKDHLKFVYEENRKSIEKINDLAKEAMK